MIFSTASYRSEEFKPPNTLPSFFADHQVKELQTHTYTAEALPMTELQQRHQQLQKSPPTSPVSSQHLSSPQQQQQQLAGAAEYLQGHDGSFYINPGNLMRQVRSERDQIDRIECWMSFMGVCIGVCF